MIGRNVLSWKERFEMDVWYVDNFSLIIDIKIFFKTIISVIQREGISSYSSDTMEDFLGNTNV